MKLLIDLELGPAWDDAAVTIEVVMSAVADVLKEFGEFEVGSVEVVEAGK